MLKTRHDSSSGVAPVGGPLTNGTPPGSLRHFAVLYSGASEPGVLAALYAFEKEIDDTVRASSHEVAHARLQWWRGEIDRLMAGHSSHPIAIALQALQPMADCSLLHETLVAADITLARMTFATSAELEAYCLRASGAVQLLAAQACAGNRELSVMEQTFARELGAVVRQTTMLRDLRRDLGLGLLHVPLQRLEAAGLDALALKPDSTSRSFLDLIAEWHIELAARLAALPSVLSPPERATQRHGLILAALHAKLLERIDHRSELARVRAEVPSWTRLWTAWRTAVRFN